MVEEDQEVIYRYRQQYEFYWQDRMLAEEFADLFSNLRNSFDVDDRVEI